MRISDWSSDVCSSDLRFSGSVLDEDEACERHHGDGNHSKNDRRIPGEAVPAQAGEKDQSGKRNRHPRGSGDIDCWPPPLGRRREGDGDDAQRCQTERQVDVKAPAPAQMLDKKAPDQGTEDRRKSEYTAKDALIASALAWGADIADGRHRRANRASPPQTLESTDPTQHPPQ